MALKYSLLLSATLGMGLVLPHTTVAEEITENFSANPAQSIVSAETSEASLPNIPDAETLEVDDGRVSSLSALEDEQALEDSRAFVEDLLKSAVNSGENNEEIDGSQEIDNSQVGDRGTILPAEPDTSSFPTVLKLGRLQNDIQELQNSPATLYSYEIGGRDATTVYFDGLPLLTFVADPIEPDSTVTDSNSLDVADTSLERATQLTAKLNVLAQQDLDEVKIELATEDGYAIAVDGDVLVAIDESVALDRPGDYSGTATTAVNQLRNLLGVSPVDSTNGNPAAGVVAASFSSIQRGLASWYGPGFAGRRSANGEIFNPELLTAAHRYLPFGTMVEVVNVSTGSSVVVRITDRGPFIHNRVIDLSAAAARTIGLLGAGVGPVELRILTP